MKSAKDTIVAISTPQGRGGIGVIRLSGPDAIGIGKKVFTPARPEFFFQRRMTYGTVVRGNGEAVDQALAFHISAPNTYTGQDIFEIQAHGGPVVLNQVIRICCDKGARLAEPGEFTYRAFMAGKMDLTQAEAVVDLINAKTRKGSELAAGQLTGTLKEKIQAIEDRAISVLSALEASIDFEEEIDRKGFSDLEKELRLNIIPELDKIIQQSESACLYREGPKVALVGRVNAGKSTLMNALCRRDRAITSEEPGTTRDYLEAEIEIDGLPVTLVDTAGIREETEGLPKAEIEGQKRTREIAECSEVVIHLIDMTEKNVREEIDTKQGQNIDNAMIILNKADLIEDNARKEWEQRADENLLIISAKKGTGLEKLRNQIKRRLLKGSQGEEGMRFLPNQRQAEALREAKGSFEGVMKGLISGLPAEYICVDIRDGLSNLAQVTGGSITEKLLDQIFSKFCIGK